MLRIISNAASLAAQHQIRLTQRETGSALKQLASGSRYSEPSKDAAGFAIAENMRAQVKGFEAARRNSDNASSFIQVAEGALAEQNNILIRMRELSIQAASDNYSDTEREFLNYEFNQLNTELDRIAKTSKFGSTPLLNGTTTDYEFQVGVHAGEENIIRYTSDTNTTTEQLGVAGLEITEQSGARESLSAIDDALKNINQARAKFGAIQSRLDSSTNHIDSQIENLSEAYSRMADVNVAEAVTQARKGQILQQYQAAALNMANQIDEYALRLVG